MPFIGNKPSAVPLTSADITDGIITVADIASGTGGLVAWQSVQTTGFTAVKGRGYPCNTTSAAFTATLPASATIGDFISFIDYAGTFDTNNLTIGRNGHNIQGSATDLTVATERAGFTLVYVDATQGWIVTDSGNRSDLPPPQFVAATGGCIATSGDYKIHTFTGPGTFTVSSLGNPAGGGSNVDYLVVAGGGSGAQGYAGGGGGAGGFRMSNSGSLPAPTTSPLANPTGLSVTATAYPITVGSGGASSPGVGLVGSSLTA